MCIETAWDISLRANQCRAVIKPAGSFRWVHVRKALRSVILSEVEPLSCWLQLFLFVWPSLRATTLFRASSERVLRPRLRLTLIWNDGTIVKVTPKVFYRPARSNKLNLCSIIEAVTSSNRPKWTCWSAWLATLFIGQGDSSVFLFLSVKDLHIYACSRKIKITWNFLLRWYTIHTINNRWLILQR